MTAVVVVTLQDHLPNAPLGKGVAVHAVVRRRYSQQRGCFELVASARQAA